MPASFIEDTWVNWLPKSVANPFYRAQLTAHLTELECQVSNLSQEIERQSGGLLDQRDAAVDLRQRLKHLLETGTRVKQTPPDPYTTDTKISAH